MDESVLHRVETRLPLEEVWKIFMDISNWAAFSGFYKTLRWFGPAWAPGSRIIGSLREPRLHFHYYLESLAEFERISYIAHGIEAGFATHRTIRFKRHKSHTAVEVLAYSLGNPVCQIPEKDMELIRQLIIRWFDGFASFCEAHAAQSGCRLDSLVPLRLAGTSYEFET